METQTDSFSTLSGAETQQPLNSTPRELYKSIRAKWPFEKESSLLRTSLGRTYQPIRALAPIGKGFPPLAPQLLSSGAAVCETGYAWEAGRLPHLPELCQLALLWAINGERESGERLGRWLLSFAQDKPILSLWCGEKEYKESEGLFSFALLVRAFGDKALCESLMSQVKGEVDPFLTALAQHEISFSGKASVCGADPELGLSLFKKEKMDAAFTLTGWGTPLGMIRSGHVEVRALGPQALPLTDSNRFGICQLPRDIDSKSWTRCFAYPEIWLRLQTEVEEKICRIHLRFSGVKPETPLAFVFYVKAESCSVGGEMFRPKSLRRYSGSADGLLLKAKESQLELRGGAPHKVQVIPLAGEGCFWDSEFLISFEIHPLEANVSFVLECK